MTQQHLATYLNDHLAGSVVGIELVEQLAKEHAGTPQGRLFTELLTDIQADRQELETLLAKLEIAVSSPRKAMAWLSEKLAQLKLRMDDPGSGALRLFETLEALSLGIEGKQALWRALDAAATVNPKLQGPDYTRLRQRAAEQRQRVEKQRLETAKVALDEATVSSA